MINGLVVALLMAVLILLASHPKVMGAFTAREPIIVLGRLTTLFTAAAGVSMFLLGG